MAEATTAVNHHTVIPRGTRHARGGGGQTIAAGCDQKVTFRVGGPEICAPMLKCMSKFKKEYQAWKFSTHG